MTDTNPFNYHRQPMAHAAWELGYLAGQEDLETLRAEADELTDLIHELSVRFPKVDRWLHDS